MDKMKDRCSTIKELFISGELQTGEAWEGYFAVPVRVSEVVIYNRKSTVNLKRLVDFQIVTDSNNVCAKYKDATSFEVKKFKCEAVTRMIAIQTNVRKYLDLCEVEVFGEELKDDRGPQLSFESCKASSRYGANYDCKYAMDKESSRCRGPKEFFASKPNRVGEFWEGSFTSLVAVKEVRIFNNRDKIYLKKLVDFEILTDGGKICAEYKSEYSFVMRTFKCEARTKTIKIVSRGRNLMFCEVEVFGGGVEEEALEPLKCVDMMTGKTHSKDWISQASGFCFDFKCTEDNAGFSVPDKVQCVAKDGTCVEATEEGTKFDCDESQDCTCKAYGSITAIISER